MTENGKESDKLELILKYFQKIWPAQSEILTYNPEKTDWINLYLNNQRFILLATQTDLETHGFNLEKIWQEKTTLKLGTEISLIKLKEKLIKTGLEFLPAVSETGQFSVKGNLIDFWLPGFATPFKIEITDKKISEFFSYDQNGQRQSDVNELFLGDFSQKYFKSSHFWKNFNLLFINENFSVKLEDNYFANSKKIIFSPASKDGGLDFELENILNNAPAGFLQEKIKKLNPKIIYTNQNFKPDFSSAQVVKIPDFIYLESWGSAAWQILFLVKPQIEQKKPTRKQKLFFNQIKEGDVLVHQDHGLCRFVKMTLQNVDGNANEYLELHFSGNDKLFLPPWQINKVSKYVGEPNPRLHKLSGTNWLATIKKIRAETIHLAYEIIRTQARRSLNKVSPLNKFIEEKKLAENFPYELTNDQKKAWLEIEKDMSDDIPMDRLLCGDVAFGKTELALRAAYKTVLNNGQAALLAPTTILVQQHYDLFCERLKTLGVNVGILSRWQKNQSIKQTLKDLAEGKIDVVIGTHRLLSNDVKIPKLKLLLIDEEQKFGVKDKEKLKKQKPETHTLSLSATPIPRTLNFSLSGIREISLIQTPPPGRLPIDTKISPYTDETVKTALETELARGGQAYYLVRKVKEIPALYKKLKKLIPKAEIAIAHGQLPASDLAQTMQNFDQGKIDILLCSTIIENGLDLPNVNTLVVDNAAHFGLSQLYQLRGRIGRGQRQAFAYFLFQRQKLTGLAQKRLEALQSSYELGAGFKIALKDLEIRGAGNLLGKEQHGEIAAIGLNLYSELLEESIAGLKNSQNQKPKLDVLIDLPIANSLSSQDEPENAKRLSIYQELSNIDSENELIKQSQNLFGKKLSDNANNLVNILRLKLICEKVGIFEASGQILSREPENIKITLQLIPDHNSQNILRLLEQNNNWEYDGSKLKIKTSELKNGKSSNWLEGIIEEIKFLSQKNRS